MIVRVFVGIIAEPPFQFSARKWNGTKSPSPFHERSRLSC